MTLLPLLLVCTMETVVVVVVEDAVVAILPEQTCMAGAVVLDDDDDCDGYSIFVEFQVPFVPFVVVAEVFVANGVVPRKNSCSDS